jgi:hypothetical protein
MEKMFQQDIQKFDVNVLHKTPEGYYQGNVVCTGIGVFRYLDKNKKFVQRLRDVDDVKAATASINCKPITLQHPNQPVNADNVDGLEVGMTANDATFDGLNNRVTVTITGKKAIDAIDRGEVKAFSMGYKCSVVDNDGVWQGVHHDQQQKDIVYNHLALVTRGRAGDKVNFMVGDSADFADIFDMADPEESEKKPTEDGNEHQDGQPVIVNDGKAGPEVNLKDNNHNQEQSMKTIQLDGVDYQADEKVIEALQAAQNDAAEKLDEIHTLLSAVDEKDSQIADLQEKLDKANDEIDESVIDEAVNAKLAILDAARAAGIECDSSDDVSDLKRKVIATAFDGIDLESIEDEASINALYMSANKTIADRAEKGDCGKGGKKNPASQLDGARDSEDEDVNDSYEDRLQKSLVDISNGKKKEGK